MQLEADRTYVHHSQHVNTEVLRDMKSEKETEGAATTHDIRRIVKKQSLENRRSAAKREYG